MSFSNIIQNVDRRTFLRIISFTGATGLIYPRHLLSHLVNLANSRIVIATDHSASDGLTINDLTVQTMLNSSIQALTQINDLGEAWKSLFPNIDINKTIAIKVNCINSSMPTHPPVTYALANSLQQMIFDSVPFPANNIIIFDRTNGELSSAGYTLNTSETGLRCFGTNQSGVGYGSQSYLVNGSSQRISNICESLADYLINISVLKNHGTSGVTLCMKNHYGTCSGPGSLHGNYADPYIPALNALPVLADKHVLQICDAIFGIISGGPGGSPQISPNKIIMGQDIVTVDYWGREILSQLGCTTINRATHIDTAANSPYNLGTNKTEEMEIINIENPTSSIGNQNNPFTVPDRFILQQNFPNPFTSSTHIKFYLTQKAHTRLQIFDTHGNPIRTLFNKEIPKGWHQIEWQGINSRGTSVASGIYICRLSVGSYHKSIIMQLMK
jgi:uncharacterized protein (DUF362 family)